MSSQVSFDLGIGILIMVGRVEDPEADANKQPNRPLFRQSRRLSRKRVEANTMNVMGPKKSDHEIVLFFYRHKKYEGGLLD